MKVSFITTVFNEEKTINLLLDSLLIQTRLPDEVIITDGGSNDLTESRIKNYESKFKKKNINFKLLIKKGNRSVGRNEAIKNARYEIIACADAGNILDEKWIANITKPFLALQTSPPPSPKRRGGNSNVDVVAGYYRGHTETVFQKCIVAYALVMPDHVDPKNFLPATRSMAFKKSVWKQIGEFPEEYSHNEDYVFARKLKESDAKIVFAKDAIVNWIPPSTFKQAFRTFFRFALGDIEAKIVRPKVLLVFARYFIGFYFLALCLLYKSVMGLSLLGLVFIAYLIWAYVKNRKYVDDPLALIILPIIQLTADFAVLTGSAAGFIKLVFNFNYLQYFKDNKFLFAVISIYSVLVLSTLRWGIPNPQHPFPYAMDEWHQLQAVANTFRYGTPNVFGSANGTMLQFILTGIYLMPFTILHIVDPFSLQIDNFFMRGRIFEILRLNTILWGILSIFVFYILAEILKAPKKLSLLLFVFTPIWLMLSGYFKYDIALMFWILLSLLFFFRFAKNPTRLNFILAGIPPGLAIAVKVSAIPLLPLYIILYFLFFPNAIKKLKLLLFCILIIFGIVALFGMPDTLFGKGNILFFLNENILQGPSATENFKLNENPWIYLIIQHYPTIFGIGLVLLSVVSAVFWVFHLCRQVLQKTISQYKTEAFLFISFLVFFLSLYPLQIYAGGNRSLVLLPFIVLLSTLAFKKITNKRVLLISSAVIVLILVIQIYSSLVWVSSKWSKTPHEISTQWMLNNVPRSSALGIENIPIYQNVPDIVQKEFYYQQYDIKQTYRYKYEVIDSHTKILPEYVIVTGDEIEQKLVKISGKNDLTKRLEKEKYKKVFFYKLKTPEYLPLTDDTDYYFSWMGLPPQTIAVYKK